MTRNPRALQRARLLTAGAVAAAALTTGGVGLHLAAAQQSATVSAASSTPSNASSSTPSTGTSSGNGLSAPGTVSAGSGPAQSTTSGS